MVRRLKVEQIAQILHFKLRPDTPQLYEYITVEQVNGSVLGSIFNISPWTQFFDLKGRADKPLSIVENVEMRDCSCSCDIFFNVTRKDEDYTLRKFTLRNLRFKATNKENFYDAVDGLILDDVIVG